MIILGAGMAGCIAGIVNPEAVIYEAGYEPNLNHQALLRFRDDAVGRAVRIPFKKVRVSKSIWFDGSEVNSSPRFTHWYSNKVTGKFLDRSIHDVTDVVRYVAPEDFHNQMLKRLGDRVKFNSKCEGIGRSGIVINGEKINRFGVPLITTLPIFINASLCGMSPPKSEYETTSILLSHFRIKYCDTFATVYYPDPNFPVYRASLTGDLLIVESVDKIGSGDIADVIASLGLWKAQYEAIMTNTTQKAGKIQPLEDSVRRGFLYEMTTEADVYSLGRFATWRNILLGDVLNDIDAINTMITRDEYSRRRGI